MRTILYYIVSIVVGAVLSITGQVDPTPPSVSSCCAVVCQCDGDPVACICGDDCQCSDCGE